MIKQENVEKDNDTKSELLEQKKEDDVYKPKNFVRKKRGQAFSESVETAEKEFVPPVQYKTSETKEVITRLMKTNALTRHLRDEDLEVLVESIKPFEIKQNETIIKQYDDGDFQQILQKGKASCYEMFGGKGEWPGTKKMEQKDGMAFGELALM